MIRGAQGAVMVSGKRAGLNDRGIFEWRWIIVLRVLAIPISLTFGLGYSEGRRRVADLRRLSRRQRTQRRRGAEGKHGRFIVDLVVGLKCVVAGLI